MAAAPLTVRETVFLFDNASANLFQRFEEVGYALWLGSGISFGRMKKLSDIIRDALAFLHSQIDPANPDCRFRVALRRALKLALTDVQINSVDRTQPVTDWLDIDAILSQLTNNYARLLDITVDGEDDDFLLWRGIGVTATFGDPAIEPDAEHLCIAILALEGVVPEILTANWDGLIERAISELAPNANIVNVCVRPEDVRQAGYSVQLYKFHGCAILATRDEATYRPFLIARQSQIDRWVVDHPVYLQRLISIIVSKATLMIGLSAQDANIRLVFNVAENTLNWPWPGDFPAIVFSQMEIGEDQRRLLKNVYRNFWIPANRAQIEAGSLIATWGKQLLFALVLQVLWGKLRRLIRTLRCNLPAQELEQLEPGLQALKYMIAEACTADHYSFVRRFIQNWSRILGLFRDGRVPADPHLYHFLTMSPASHIEHDVGLPATGLQELAVVVAILGTGVEQGFWKLNVADWTDPSSGGFEVNTPVARTRVFLASSGEAALHLYTSGRLSLGDGSIIIHSKSIVEPKPRSPARFRGRTGAVGLRQISISGILGEESTAAALTRRFREQLTL